jgi:hypothetical protein
MVGMITEISGSDGIIRVVTLFNSALPQFSHAPTR